ncbi:nuclear factor 7, brain-like [Oncorhynchus masou masou]|uniref:nuclear factor 7, brain-like n=1 Tax=Oncorhynchus masou masou TaxID=90313 RepID=UPI00318302F2
MAANLSLLEEHLSCPVCGDIFRNPVVLKCSHSFCEECLQKYWKEMENPLCPVCKKECSSEEQSLSLALKSLCDSLQNGGENIRSDNNCQLHGEKLKIFCFDDKQLICVVCYTSKKHKGHDCYPVEEAVPDLKSEIQAVVSTLKNKLENKNTAKMCHQSWVEHIKGQAQFAEEQISREFQKLHQFLDEEETARIATLREEERQKSEVMQEKAEALTRELTTLSETIVVIDKEMDVDNITFLQNYKAILNRANCTFPDTEDTQVVSGALIDVAKHVGSLKFKVWEKMYEFVDYTPVTMDPNTMSTKFTLSDDLTTMTYCDERQSLPDNPERFLNVGVLGSEGYSKGIHYWDVEVGDNDNWILGVAKESIPRKKQVKMEPQSGLWIIKHISGKYKACIKSHVQIKVDESPQVIRVRLDCDKGEVTFCDITKNTTLYTFKDKFTEKVFPYFNSGSKICPLRLFVAGKAKTS